MNPDPWYDRQPAELIKRQKTGDSFLNATLVDPNLQNSLYQRVLGDRAVARATFAEHYKAVTGRVLPAKVEVICVEKLTDSAADLVVFYLPDKTTPIGTPDLWRDLWTAAWPPY